MTSESLENWKDVVSSLDSHKVSAIRGDKASCSLWEPSSEEIQKVKDAANEEGLEIYDQPSGFHVLEGESFTVRDSEVN